MNSFRASKYCFAAILLITTSAMTMESYVEETKEESCGPYDYPLMRPACKKWVGPILPDFPKVLVDLILEYADPFIMIAAGENHSVLTGNGQLLTWGRNDDGRLGDGTCNDCSQPISPLPGHHVVKIAAAGSHTLALTDKGDLYAWGNNSDGQLGDGSLISRLKPVPVLTEEKFIQIATGPRNTLALTADGRVFAWGWDSDHKQKVFVPAQMQIEEPVVQIAAGGGDFSLVLTNTGKVLDWGDWFDHKGFRQAPLKGRVIQIAAGRNFAIALTDIGEVWAWGWSHEGQLGNGSFARSMNWPPIRVPIDNVTQIATAGGGLFTLALTKQGQVFGWGSNGACQIGVLEDEIANPTAIPIENVVQIAAGDRHALAMVHDEKNNEWKLFGWGSNYAGQLGSVAAIKKCQPLQIQWSKSDSPFLSNIGNFILSPLPQGQENMAQGVDGGEALKRCRVEVPLLPGDEVGDAEDAEDLPVNPRCRRCNKTCLIL